MSITLHRTRIQASPVNTTTTNRIRTIRIIIGRRSAMAGPVVSMTNRSITTRSLPTTAWRRIIPRRIIIKY